MESYPLLVGVDWGNQTHLVCVMRPDREVLAEFPVPHDGKNLAALGDRLVRLAGDHGPAGVAIAIEVPRGPVVESLLERGFHLYFINPKQLDRFRDRHTLAGAKDDRRDALVLADSLRTDRACFLRVDVDNPRIIELRELTRIDEEITSQRGRLCNRLREQLGRFFPQMLELVPAADERWLWALLDLAPTPEAARNVRPQKVAALLKRHGIRRFTAAGIVEILRGPNFQVAPGTSEAASEHIAFLLPQLQLLDEQRRQCQKRIDASLAAMPNLSKETEQGEHRDVDILLSLPGIGKNVAAAMLVEATQPLRERDYHSLRARAGVAPVTRQSGKTRTVGMRVACNHRLQEAVYHLGRVHVQHDERSRSLYKALRARGHGHARALRGVVDRVLRVLLTMLTSRTLYEPSRRTASAEVPTSAQA